MTKAFQKFRKFIVKLNWLQRLWLLAPICVWFSYRPIISLGADGTMNYELSVTLIYVVVLAMASLPTIWRNRRKLIKNKVAVAIGLFGLWSSITSLWSANLTRGVLTSGILWCLCLISWAVIAERRKIVDILPQLKKVLVVSSVAACLLALLQMILGTYIESRETIGLCAGCVASQFGFVRPNLFAIEPQFLGSLLLAPTLIVYHRLIASKRSWSDSLIFILLATTLGLTLSRGAIYACALGMAVMWLVVNKCRLNKLATIDLIIVAMIGCLCIQGGLAAINPHINETFWGAVSKSVNHLSLGLIDLEQDEPAVESTDEPSLNEDEPAFDGYVAESTDVRINLTKVALTAWYNQTLTYKLFGTGLGSSGIVMAKQTGSDYQKEIVQNEYVEILLERGVVGLVLFMSTIVTIAASVSTRKKCWLWAILIAYLAQWCFFSGLPNVLHIYLTLSLLLIV